MRINEVFFSIQGEGKSTGIPTLFIRTSGCNLQCSFCDTKYHIEGRELNSQDKQLMSKHKRWTITGGEPLLQQTEIMELISKYKPDIVEIETNGVIRPCLDLAMLVDQFNISPKERRFQPKSIKKTDPAILGAKLNRIVKFVYADKKSEKFIKDIVKKYHLKASEVWVMPEGITRKEQEQNQKTVWNYCVKNNYNFSPRLHITTWDVKRGI
jgi:7-carboxy-7-deazaguanine synthase